MSKYVEFYFDTPFGEKLKGLKWEIENPIKNFFIVTGMQEHSLRYDNFAKYLNNLGYNVYCLDHYGQGLNIVDSNCPGIWPINAFSKFETVMHEFIKKINNDNHLETILFGHSMGSFFCQDFIAKYPIDVKKVIICGTDYPKPSLMRFGYTFARLLTNKHNRNRRSKYLYKLVTGPFKNAVKFARTRFDWLSYNKDNVDRYIKDPLCGYTATVGFYFEFLKGMKGIATKKNIENINKDISILLIAGNEDVVGHFSKGPKKLKEVYNTFGINDVTLHLYPKMRHEILNENDNKIVFDDISDFLNRK